MYRRYGRNNLNLRSAENFSRFGIKTASSFFFDEVIYEAIEVAVSGHNNCLMIIWIFYHSP